MSLIHHILHDKHMLSFKLCQSNEECLHTDSKPENVFKKTTCRSKLHLHQVKKTVILYMLAYKHTNRLPGSYCMQLTIQPAQCDKHAKAIHSSRRYISKIDLRYTVSSCCYSPNTQNIMHIVCRFSELTSLGYLSIFWCF